MPLTLNSTIAALNSQQNPKKTQGDISSTAQVLPSGSATPPRPESAVTITIDAQINRALNTTHPPVIAFNEAIAVGQTAEKALDEINSALVKIRETTRQAVTGSDSRGSAIAPRTSPAMNIRINSTTTWASWSPGSWRLIES